MYPHRIRLRGPWQWEPLELRGPGPLPGPQRVTMPCRLADGGFAGFAGRVRMTRKFGYPGRIDADERVWLTIDGVEGQASITLNGQLLAANQQVACDFDVTGLLGPRNSLEVELDAANDHAGLWGEVALEVRCSAYLDQLKVTQTGAGLRVEGMVAGTAPNVLELYVMVDRRHAHYQKIAASDVFRVDLPQSGKIVRVELVNVSAIWYAAELPVVGLES